MPWLRWTAAAGPLGTATAAGIAVASTPAFSAPPFLAGALILWPLLLAISACDARALVVPDSLTAALLLAGLAHLIWFAPDDILQRLAGAVATALAGCALSELARRSLGRAVIGMGDLKLIPALALWTGIGALPTILLVASLSGLAAAAAIRLSRGRPVRYLPFAPHLAAGAWFTWLAGPLIFL
jgi:prepilin signal peptidase PulO-like enzyme (type II secretory pathway)